MVSLASPNVQLRLRLYTCACNIDIGPITLSDYYHSTDLLSPCLIALNLIAITQPDRYHSTYEDTVTSVTMPQSRPPNPTSGNNLTNGKGDFGLLEDYQRR